MSLTKIDTALPSLPTAAPAGPARPAGAAAPAASPAAAEVPAQVGAGGTDQVSVSAAGAQLGRMDAGSGDFDSAKVQAIREAIQQGRFKVNPEAVADRLIADATALLGPRSTN